MQPASWLSHPASANQPSPEQLQALLTRAQALQRGALQHQQPLLGKRLGLMCSIPDSQEAQSFHRAAQELGAHVALIPASLDQGGTARQQAGIGRLLGRLYDAVECQGTSPDTVCQLAATANIPMYAGLACSEHPIVGLAAKLDAPASLADRQRWLIQAALLVSLV